MEEFFNLISQNTFSQVVSFTGVFASIVSLILTAITFFYAIYSQRRKLQESEESRFANVLESDNITDLGNYLDETIGQFTIHEYTSSSDIANRVDKYIERIQEFVGTEEQISSAPTTEPPEEIDLEYENLPGEFRPIFEELRTGEPWNALARLRRLIEIRLRDKAISLGFKERNLKSAGQVLKILFDRKYVAPNFYKMLRYSISVCNRAIHGIEIQENEAENAIYSAVEALHDVGIINHQSS